MKARQALDETRKFVKTMIDIYRVVYTAQTKARKALDRSRKFVKTTIYLNRVVYKTKKYRQRSHQQKIKKSPFNLQVQCSITEAGVQRSIASSIVIRRRNINVKIIYNLTG